MIIRLLFCLAAISLAGCAGRPPAAIRAEGKVHIRYTFTDADAAAPAKAFHVYGAPASIGPFERINREPIPAPAKPAPGTVALLATDYALPLGASRFYYIEAEDAGGKRRKITSVAAARVVLPLEPSDEAAAAAVRAARLEKLKTGKAGT